MDDSEEMKVQLHMAINAERPGFYNKNSIQDGASCSKRLAGRFGPEGRNGRIEEAE